MVIIKTLFVLQEWEARESAVDITVSREMQMHFGFSWLCELLRMEKMFPRDK